MNKKCQNEMTDASLTQCYIVSYYVAKEEKHYQVIFTNKKEHENFLKKNKHSITYNISKKVNLKELEGIKVMKG